MITKQRQPAEFPHVTQVSALCCPLFSPRFLFICLQIYSTFPPFKSISSFFSPFTSISPPFPSNFTLFSLEILGWRDGSRGGGGPQALNRPPHIRASHNGLGESSPSSDMCKHWHACQTESRAFQCDQTVVYLVLLFCIESWSFCIVDLYISNAVFITPRSLSMLSSVMKPLHCDRDSLMQCCFCFMLHSSHHPSHHPYLLLADRGASPQTHAAPPPPPPHAEASYAK